MSPFQGGLSDSPIKTQKIQGTITSDYQTYNKSWQTGCVLLSLSELTNSTQVGFYGIVTLKSLNFTSQTSTTAKRYIYIWLGLNNNLEGHDSTGNVMGTYQKSSGIAQTMSEFKLLNRYSRTGSFSLYIGSETIYSNEQISFTVDIDGYACDLSNFNNTQRVE